MIALTRTAGGKSWETWRDLMAYIVKTYHDSLKAALPRLEGLMDQVARERRVPIHLLDRLLREFSALADSLRTNLSQQEGHLFPMIRHVCLSVEEAGWPCHLGDAVEELIDEATRDDQEAMASVNRVEEGLGRMEWEGKGPLVGKLVKGLRELGEDLEEHIQLETSVLFPVVRALLRGNNQTIKRLLEEGSRSQTGPPLERSVHASAFNRWLNTVMEEMGYRHRDSACRAVRSVLHALRDRLSVDDAIAFGARLPREVRGLYYEDWQHRWDPAMYARKEEFLSQVAEAIKDDTNRDPEKTARSIFRVLAKHMPADEIEGLTNTLPGEIRSLWPSEGLTSPVDELIVADQETG